MFEQERRALLPTAYVVRTCFLFFRCYEITAKINYHIRMAHGIQYESRGIGVNRPKKDDQFNHVFQLPTTP